MDITQAKTYCKQTIKTQSGKRIAEVLKRYYKLKNSAPDVFEVAKEIFEGEEAEEANKQGGVT
jgi:predicted CopG family antitoxin